MGDLYLTGGEQRGSVFLYPEEWHSSRKAVVLRIDTNTSTITDKFEYETPSDACPPNKPQITFKACTLYDDKLYACTCTEVIVFELPSFRRVGYVSLPCFNDLHHVMPTPNGTLVVVVTGLDMVVEITPNGEILREWSVVGEDTWSRFSRKVDYRKVASTKPHRAHPNFAFLLSGDIWTTRCDCRDAICLTSPRERIDIGVSFPHDGHTFRGWIYFTTIDGHVVIADSHSLKVEGIVDLTVMDNPEGHVLGFCRGLLPVTETLVWVGFTRLRPTKFVDKLHWLKSSELNSKPTHIALYDLSTGHCLREIELSPYGLDLIFGIIDFPTVSETHSFLAGTVPAFARE
jgi:hypothetical protein